ncbi:MAG: TrmH family RNA methyltransferase [Candidatus Saccharibacteria bacterium]|nr:TrmH family RNA methyltransferase [Candidatus Saccharibacteria bacterium]
MEIVLALHNIRSTYNVGAILRTAEGLGVSRVICSGYTPWFDKPGVLPHLASKLERQIHKSALGAEKMVPTSWASDISKSLTKLREDGYQILGLENNLEKETVLLSDSGLPTLISDKVVLVLGEEVEGISPELYDRIDLFLEIPMEGQKESFNVSVAAGMALFRLRYLRA